MKKLLRQWLLILTAAILLPATGFAYDVKIDGIYYNLDDTNNTASVDYGFYEGDVRIPASIINSGKSYSVTSIGNSAFYYCTGLTSIDIPASVTSIGDYAFYICTGLTSINIPTSVTSIGGKAFRNCTGLTSIDIPASVTSIVDGAFTGCTGLTSIDIPASVTSIGNHAFWKCTGLTSIDIPASVTSIGGGAFMSCTGLTSIDIPASVTSIGNSAFYYCTGLTSIDIPASVTSIGVLAFANCTGLTSINVDSRNNTYSSKGGVLFNKEQTMLMCCPAGKCGEYIAPTSVTSIGYGAFYDCVGLTGIGIPPSVTSIGDGAFYGCTGLTSIYIPSSVTSIGEYAFWGCTGLTSITIPASVTSIEASTFASCTGLTSIDIPAAVTSIGEYAFSGCTGLTSITIPASVTSIEASTFASCTGLTSIDIPASVTSIGDAAFYGCKLQPLNIQAPENLKTIGDPFKKLDNESFIFVPNEAGVALISQYTSCDIYALDGVPFKIDVSSYLKGVKIRICDIWDKAKDYFTDNFKTASVSISWTDGLAEDEELTPDENGNYMKTGLPVNTHGTVTLRYLKNGEAASLQKSVSTQAPSLGIAQMSKTQTTVGLEVSATKGDTTALLTEIGVVYDGRKYASDTADQRADTTTVYGIVSLNGLAPGKEIAVNAYAVYGGEQVTFDSWTFKPDELRPTVSVISTGPTSFQIDTGYEEGDATVTETGVTVNGTEVESLLQTGLKPETTYEISYYVDTREGSHETVTQSVTTPALVLTTLQPKGVSSTCSIVTAETNISEEETGVGFQWKAYDAPATLEPSEGYGAIYDGRIEGYISNLQPTSYYYDVRAFYKSSDDTYYYGDWVTFAPSDFSYVDPTVHTYAATEVTHNSARARGYVLPGTDEIEEQGFEYWPEGGSQNSARRVAAAPEEQESVATVLSTGQVMTAELRDLQPGTAYRCRAFVKTSAGMTYGEEQTFMTEDDPTGIGSVETGTTEPAIVGFYDQSGRKWDTPQRGLYIVRYSDGTTRKVFVK